MLEAFDAGIVTIGAGGDNPRNVLCSPLSGVEKGEYFDVSPYAKAASDFLINLIDKIKLPRKLKVGFSNSPENIVHATYRDMGFVAKANGKFDLYTAGGLGLNPEFGVKTAVDIEPNDYHPLLGNPSVEILKDLYNLVSSFQDVSIRLSTKEEIFITNLSAQEANKLADMLSTDNASTDLQESVTCVGATICQQGLCDSSGLLQKIVEVDKEEKFADGVLPKLCTSGCQSSCAAHQTAVVGLKGGKKKIDGTMADVFDIFYGGFELQEKERFGDIVGTVSVKNIPEMFRKLGKEIQAQNLTFESWIKNNKGRFFQIVEGYTI